MPVIKVNNIDMFYKVVVNEAETETIGNGQPAMMVLHGGPGIVDHQIEFDAWKQFSPSLQVIFLDQRGSGRTEDGPRELWNLSQCGRDIKSFCDALGIAKPIIAGVSWGGYVAMSYATQFPEHPAALVLCNTEAKVDLEAKRTAYKIAFERLGISCNTPPYSELGSNRETVMKLVGEIACEYDQNPSEVNFTKFVKYCLPLFSRNNFALIEPCRVNMEVRKKFIGEESLVMDFSSELPKVNCPVLQLAGDRDPTHPAVCAESTARCFKKARFVCFTDAGAPVYMDQNKTFVETVSAFMQDNSLTPKALRCEV